MDLQELENAKQQVDENISRIKKHIEYAKAKVDKLYHNPASQYLWLKHITQLETSIQEQLK